MEWEEASGRGRVYTWSTVHRNDLPPFDGRCPYVVGVVELEEGPRVVTELVGCGEVRAGMGVVVGFREGVPVFGPGGACP